jgi:hypothetical protein
MKAAITLFQVVGPRKVLRRLEHEIGYLCAAFGFDERTHPALLALFRVLPLSYGLYTDTPATFEEKTFDAAELEVSGARSMLEQFVREVALMGFMYGVYARTVPVLTALHNQVKEALV